MFLEFTLYKIYTRLFEKHDSSPLFRTFILMFLNIEFILLFIYISLSCINRNLIKYKNVNLEISLPDWVAISILFVIIPVMYTYIRFFYKKEVNYYKNKYENHWLNRFYFDALLFLIPFFIFSIGPAIPILLFGGEILNHEIEGYLTFLFQ